MQSFRSFKETFTLAPTDFIKTTPMQNVWDPKNVTSKFLAQFFFTYGQLSHKHIVNNLKQFGGISNFCKIS